MIAPVILTLARQDEFTASAEIRRVPPNAADRLAADREPPAITFVSDPRVRLLVVAAVPSIGDTPLADHVRIKRGSGPGPASYVITATAGDTSEARRIAGSTARAIVGVSATVRAAGIKKALATARREFRQAPGSARGRLGGRVFILTDASVDPASPFAITGTTGASPSLTSPVDKLVDGLPGSYRSGPSVVAVGLVGLVCAAALLAWVYLLTAVSPPLPRRPEDAA